MSSCDIAEGQRGSKRDAGTGIVPAHDDAAIATAPTQRMRQVFMTNRTCHSRWNIHLRSGDLAAFATAAISQARSALDQAAFATGDRCSELQPWYV